MATNPYVPDEEHQPDEEAADTVTCFVSGAVVAKEHAVLVRLAPGQRVWMLPKFCSEADTRRR